MLEEKIIRRFSLSLTEKIQKDNINLDMMWINEFSKELLKVTLGEDYDFPINIDKVAEELKLQVVVTTQVKPSDTAYLHIMNKGILNPNLKALNLLISPNASNLERRIAVSYGLLKYLIHYCDYKFFAKYRASHILENYTEIEDLWIEEIAYLLLMPVDLTLKETTFFLEENPYTDEEVIHYMSIVAEIPKEKIPIIFNEIKKIQLHITKTIKVKLN